MAPAQRTFVVGLVQMRCTPDPRENLDNALARIREAAQRGASVVCLPELFRTQYFCQREDPALFELAEPIPGPTTEALARVAKSSGVAVIGSIFERRAAGVYHNSAVVLDADGSFKGVYRKMHIPDDPLYYEKYYFTPGDLGFRAFDTKAGRIAPLVCWDQWYPEGARLAALAGANVLFYPTAIGWHPREKAEHGSAQASAWQTIQRAHAIANGVYVCAVNRVGYEGPQEEPASPATGGARRAQHEDAGLEFWGGSFVCDPFGVVLQEASRTDEQVLVQPIDLARQEDVRRNWPFLRDRRIDAYGEVTKRLID
jgi:N-carbamoylputrescine amidase